MANANLARGLVPVRYRSGASYNGAANVYYVPATDSTALFLGDPVFPVTDASDANGIPTVIIATAAGGNYVLGAIVGIVSHGDPVVARTRDSPVYRAASTAAYLLVADDPDLLFEMQEDGLGGVMTIGAGSRNVDLIAGTGSTVTGRSGWMLDSSTQQTTNTLQMRILRPVERPDNDTTIAYAKWLVSINLHSARNLTGV
jgi:hypothetical protein